MPDALERDLRELGELLEYPASPDFAPRVARAIRVSSTARRARAARPLRRSLVLAALALLLAAATVLAASPGARDAVLDLFGLDGATVEVVPRLPDVPPGATGPESLGASGSLAEARRRVDFAIVTAPRGRPRGVRVSHAVEGGLVAFEQQGLLVVQFRGTTARELLGKLAAEGTRVERLRVDDGRAVWLEGRPHVVFVRDANGRVLEESLRRAGNVLLVERDGLLIRVEGAERRAAAVAYARSLR